MEARFIELGIILDYFFSPHQELKKHQHLTPNSIKQDT